SEVRIIGLVLPKRWADRGGCLKCDDDPCPVADPGQGQAISPGCLTYRSAPPPSCSQYACAIIDTACGWAISTLLLLSALPALGCRPVFRAGLSAPSPPSHRFAKYLTSSHLYSITTKIWREINA